MTKQEIIKKAYSFRGANREFSQEMGPLVEAIVDLQGDPAIEVTDIESLTAAQLDSLNAGDTVAKVTGNEKHIYLVAYKDEVKGEMALVYADAWNIEEVYYEKTGGVWGFVVKDISAVNGRLEAPEDEGTDGQILALQSGKPAWVNAPEGTVVVDSSMSNQSENPVQNKVIKTYVDTADAAKADKVSGATNGNFAGLNASGNLTDSGKKPSDYYDKAQIDALLATKLTKGEYDASTAVGLADNIRGDVYADEQFAVRMTGGEANEVGGIGVVQQLKGAGAAIVQMFPEGANHDFSGDVSLDGTGGNAEAVLRYRNEAGTVEMGYLLAMEAFISQTLTQAQLDAISAKDTGKADRDKAVWLTPAGAITSAPTIESGQTEVTFSGWRIAMRVTAGEVRDASASSYWFTSGTKGRQVYDVAVAEGIDWWKWEQSQDWYKLANGWNTGSAMEYLQHMAAQGLPTHQVKAMSALLAVTKIGIKTVKSRNLLNPQTGRALLKAYVNDDETYLDNEYTMLGGLPTGATMAFTSLLTGKTETLTMLDSTHFVIPSDGWLQITGTLPESIICTWNGEKDNTAADEYATESHTWDVTQLFGTKDGGTEGHYYRFAKEGMRGAGRAQDVVELVGAEGKVKVWDANIASLNLPYNSSYQCFQKSDALPSGTYQPKNVNQRAKTQPGLVAQIASQWIMQDRFFRCNGRQFGIRINSYNGDATAFNNDMQSMGAKIWYELATPITFTSLFLSASSTADELTAMPADAIPLSEIQFADNNCSIEEAIYDAPEADANGVITPTAVTGQMRIQYSLDAAEQIDTLQKEYAALEARVTALENR